MYNEVFCIILNEQLFLKSNSNNGCLLSLFIYLFIYSLIVLEKISHCSYLPLFDSKRRS